MRAFIKQVVFLIPFCVPLWAGAAPSLRLIEGTNVLTIADGGAGDSNSVAGVVSYIGGLGTNWTLNVMTGVSKPSLGSSNAPQFDLSVLCSSARAATLTILFSDDSFAPAAGTFVSSIGGTTEGALTYEVFADAGNVLFGETLPLTAQGPFNPPGFSGTKSTNATLNSTYAVTKKIVVTHGANGVTSFNTELVLLTNDAPPLLLIVEASAIVLNPQTGLFEQTIRLRNAGSNAVAAARVLISGLPTDVTVYNASGATNSTPFVQHNLPLSPDGTVDFVVEYYRSNRVAIAQPTFIPQAVSATVVTPPSGTIIAVDRSVQLANGRFLIEFTSTPGARYAIQYSADMIVWKTAVPAITAAANRVQWLDDGPPKTESKPTAVGSRFYRVIQLP